MRIILIFIALNPMISCQTDKSKFDVNELSVISFIAKQIEYEKHDVSVKKYLVGNESISVSDENLKKLSDRLDTALISKIVPLSENFSKERTCNFTGDNLPYLSLIDKETLVSQKDRIKNEITGLFGLSCIKYDSKKNIGLYYFDYICGGECGHSGFVIFRLDQKNNVTIIDVIYTGIS